MEKLKYQIEKGRGPSLHELLHSLGRRTNENNCVYDVMFFWRDERGHLHEVQVIIQGLERPTKTGFWKIRASCDDLIHKHLGEINMVALYNPDKRIGYLDFTQPQKNELMIC